MSTLKVTWNTSELDIEKFLLNYFDKFWVRKGAFDDDGWGNYSFIINIEDATDKIFTRYLVYEDEEITVKSGKIYVVEEE